MGMSPELIGWLGLIIFVILLFTGIPIIYTLAIVGFGGFGLITGFGPAAKTLGITFFSNLASNGFAVVPLFLLMGYFMHYSGVVSNLFTIARKWLGHITGGLPIATVLGGVGFSAVSGSGLASTATLARVTVPDMIKNGVDKKLAYGVVTSTGPLAQMIPPSTLMIIYAILAEESISKLLIGGLIPGLVVAALYILMIYIRVKVNPNLSKKLEKVSLKERIVSLKDIWGFFLIVSFVIGGIYTGLFTPTEAGAMGAFAAMILAIFRRKFNFKTIKLSILETVRTTSMVFMILGSSFIFGSFLAITRLPTKISTFLTSLPVPSIVIIIGIIIFFLILGMFIDMLAAMFITLPIILPAVELMGYDMIWFGVMIVFLAEVALVTPPLGISLFIVKGVIKDSDFTDIIKGSIPFIAIDLVAVALFLIFPWLITLLPNLMSG